MIADLIWDQVSVFSFSLKASLSFHLASIRISLRGIKRFGCDWRTGGSFCRATVGCRVGLTDNSRTMAAAILHVCSSPEREVDVGIGVPPNGRGSAEAPESSSSSGGCRSGMSSEAENDMATTRIRFAPTDSTLPVPWKALLGVVDGHEHVYFWNPVTNVTQYEKPQSSVTEGDAHATRNVRFSCAILSRLFLYDESQLLSAHGINFGSG